MVIEVLKLKKNQSDTLAASASKEYHGSAGVASSVLSSEEQKLAVPFAVEPLFVDKSEYYSYDE